MARIVLKDQLEKSETAQSLIITDNTNSAGYLKPGINGQVLSMVGGIVGWSNNSSLATVIRDTFSVNNGDITVNNDSITLSGTLSSGSILNVFRGGKLCHITSDYTVAGNVITFVTPFINTDEIDIEYTT